MDLPSLTLRWTHLPSHFVSLYLIESITISPEPKLRREPLFRTHPVFGARRKGRSEVRPVNVHYVDERGAKRLLVLKLPTVVAAEWHHR